MLSPWSTRSMLGVPLLLVSVGLGASSLGSVVSPSAAPVSRDAAVGSTHTSNPRAAASMTTIVLRIHTCRHCPVYLQQAIVGRPYWTSKMHRVRGGHASFRVPTRRTSGMSFVLNPRWADVTNAVTNIVTQYAHTAVGQTVSNDVARHKKRASACWAGTSRHRVVLHARAVKFPGRALGGGPGHALRAWFSPTRVATPLWSHTWRGTLGNQDAYPCSP
jgi:hypothetical protein